MIKYRIIYHDPTDEILKLKMTEKVPDFCDVLAFDLDEIQVDIQMKKWRKHFNDMENLKIERMRLFNAWKNLAGDFLFETGSIIFQNQMKITDKIIDEWKDGVKIRHQILNNKLKTLYKQSLNYLESVKK